MNSISDRVLRLRDEKKFSRKDLAELAEVSQPTIYNIENGKTDNITLSVGKKIAKALGISFGELFEIETNTVDWEHYQNELDKLWAALKEKNSEISDLKKQIEQKDLLIDYLKKITEQLQYSVAEQFIYNGFYELNRIEEKLLLATSEKEIFELKTERELTTEYLEDIDVYVNENILSVTELLFILFEVAGFKKLMENKSLNQSDFISNCANYINQFSKTEKKEIEKYIEKNVSTKWNPINIKKNKPEIIKISKTPKN